MCLVDCNQPGSSVDGVFQARMLEQIAMSFSRGSSPSREWTRVFHVSCIAGGFLMHRAIREASVLLDQSCKSGEQGRSGHGRRAAAASHCRAGEWHGQSGIENPGESSIERAYMCHKNNKPALQLSSSFVTQMMGKNLNKVNRCKYYFL